MALDTIRLNSLLAYCKLTELADDPEVELLIPGFYDAAVEYMADAGVSEPSEGTGRKARFDLLVNRMVLEAWETRNQSVASASVTESRSFRRMLNQLKLTKGMVSDSDTGTGEE